MSEDLTKKLPGNDSEKIALILTLVRSIESRIDRLEHRLEDFDRGLGSLENKVDERLYDTRPIWEKVVADIGVLQEGQTRLESNVREISFKLDVLNDTMLNVQAKHKDVDTRVRQLEAQQKPTNSQT